MSLIKKYSGKGNSALSISVTQRLTPTSSLLAKPSVGRTSAKDSKPIWKMRSTFWRRLRALMWWSCMTSRGLKTTFTWSWSTAMEETWKTTRTWKATSQREKPGSYCNNWSKGSKRSTRAKWCIEIWNWRTFFSISPRRTLTRKFSKTKQRNLTILMSTWRIATSWRNKWKWR